MKTVGKLFRTGTAVAIMGVAMPAVADWHEGTIRQFGIGYDGSTITFQLSGFTRTNCTCYSGWPNQMCLDRARPSFKEEYASLLRARTTGQTIQVNIDEATCKVIAIFEVD